MLESGVVLGFVVGLVVGWNLLPQPGWVKSIYDKILSKFKGE